MMFYPHLLSTFSFLLEELLSIIEALKMKPEDVTPQQKARIQLIQNILVGKDPELRAQLLSLMSEGWSPTGEDNMAANVCYTVEEPFYNKHHWDQKSLLYRGVLLHRGYIMQNFSFGEAL